MEPCSNSNRRSVAAPSFHKYLGPVQSSTTLNSAKLFARLAYNVFKFHACGGMYNDGAFSQYILQLFSEPHILVSLSWS